MTANEVRILNQEFSDEFDVLYNNISSNQAPGLDEYEKSLFLTKAQDEIVKSYFSPFLNKIQAGYDDNQRRQIDFSMITKSKIYNNSYKLKLSLNSIQADEAIPWSDSPIRLTSEGEQLFGIVSISGNTITITTIRGGKYEQNDDSGELAGYVFDYLKDIGYTVHEDTSEVESFQSPIFDLRYNTRSIEINEDILMFINEYVEVERDNKEGVRLQVESITYAEYTRVMSKPYKRPMKNKAWRLLDNADGSKRSEIIIGPGDTLEKYVIRYVKRPRPIRLRNFEGEVTIGGGYDEQCCELDPILFPEIIQRAAEMAYAVYRGNLADQISLGQTSQTNVGAVQQSRSKE